MQPSRSIRSARTAALAVGALLVLAGVTFATAGASPSTEPSRHVPAVSQMANSLPSLSLRTAYHPFFARALRGTNRALFGALERKATGVHVTFLENEDEGDDRIRLAYPAATLERMAAVKGRYDPTNVLHRNQNIRPA